MVFNVDYISTRDSSRTPATFTDILLGGLAPDGGLYLPAEYPQLSDEQLTAWRSLLAEKGYAAVAAEVLKIFVDDIPAEDLEGIAARAYTTPKFADEEIVPVTELEDGLYIGHLSEASQVSISDCVVSASGVLRV